MRYKILNLWVLIGIISFANANASSVVTITALQSPVWLQQDGSKTELKPGSLLRIGDKVAAGDTGRVEMKLWGNAILQLNSNSEIGIKAGEIADKNGDNSTPGVDPELYFYQGRGCINYTARPSGENRFRINLGDAMFVAVHLNGDVCVLRRQGLSAIKLRAGSVEITHSVGQDMIILSETGTEFRIEDNGSYEISFPGSDELSPLEIEKPFFIEQVIEDEVAGNSPEAVESDNTANDELIETEIVNGPVKAAQETQSTHVYTVYLFSTRSKDVADQANQKFQDAGHDTQIYETTGDSGSRYRIAVSGFESRQAAEDYSDSIVGNLGVTGTWIGKESR